MGSTITSSKPSCELEDFKKNLFLVFYLIKLEGLLLNSLFLVAL